MGIRIILSVFFYGIEYCLDGIRPLLTCMKSFRDENRGCDCVHGSRVIHQEVISDKRRVKRNGMLFSQAGGAMIFVLSTVFISIDSEVRCTWKEAEALP
jgi:hypothetical protein